MENFSYDFKNSIFTKQAIKAAKEKAIKKESAEKEAVPILEKLKALVKNIRSLLSNTGLKKVQ